MLTALQLHPSPELEALARQSLGDNHWNTKAYSKANSHLRAALSIGEQQGWLRTQAQALRTLGMIAADLKEHTRALHYYRRAMRLAKKANDLDLFGKCIGNVGIAHKNLGGEEHLHRAVRYHEHALRIARDIGDKQSEGRTLGNLGITYSDLGQKDIAQDYYLQAKGIADDLADIRHSAVWLANAGMDYIGINDEAAKDHLLKAIQIFTRLDIQPHVDECQKYLATIA